MLDSLKQELRSFSNPEKAKILQRFFKTGKGQYGEGDVFLGVMVPQTRSIAKKYIGLPLTKIKELLNSPIHEERLLGGIILVEKYNSDKANVANFYLMNAKSFNNWDLVDLTAPKILGEFLLDKNKKILYDFSKSKNLWERRIAIISTFTFIRNNKFEDTLEISEILLEDKEDLIHKAVGWMLREIGKREIVVLENFLKRNYKKMPRTMLRYAIEKFNKEERAKYLEDKI